MNSNTGRAMPSRAYSAPVFNDLSPSTTPGMRKKHSLPGIEVPEFEMDSEVLCTTYIPSAIRIKGGQYMQVGENEKIEILNRKQARKGVFICRGVAGEGDLAQQHLDITQHAGNIYLEALDVLIAHPALLKHLLKQEFEEVPDHPKVLVQLLLARKILGRALKGLFAEELAGANTVDKISTLLRLATPPVKICTILLENNKAVENCKQRFVESILEVLRREKLNKPIDGTSLLSVLDLVIDHLGSIPIHKYPDEVQLMLYCLSEAVKKEPKSKETADKVQKISITKLIGSIVILRCLVPAIAQPPDTVQLLEKQNLLLIGKTLQSIASEEIPKGLESHAGEFNTLVEKLRPILMNLSASLPPKIVPIAPLVSEASRYYWLIMRQGRTFQDDKALQDELNRLEIRLGTIPDGPNAPVPRKDEIDRICERLKIMSLGNQ